MMSRRRDKLVRALADLRSEATREDLTAAAARLADLGLPDTAAEVVRGAIMSALEAQLRRADAAAVEELRALEAETLEHDVRAAQEERSAREEEEARSKAAVEKDKAVLDRQRAVLHHGLRRCDKCVREGLLSADLQCPDCLSLLREAEDRARAEDDVRFAKAASARITDEINQRWLLAHADEIRAAVAGDKPRPS